MWYKSVLYVSVWVKRKARNWHSACDRSTIKRIGFLCRMKRSLRSSAPPIFDPQSTATKHCRLASDPHGFESRFINQIIGNVPSQADNLSTKIVISNITVVNQKVQVLLFLAHRYMHACVYAHIVVFRSFYVRAHAFREVYMYRIRPDQPNIFRLCAFPWIRLNTLSLNVQSSFNKVTVKHSHRESHNELFAVLCLLLR